MVKVVIADDDSRVARMEARVMESLGYCSILCGDGLRALAVLEDNPDVDLLIADISMPNMDGRELVNELRRRARFQKLPIILTSGIAHGAEVADLLDSDATCFLGKPVDVAELKAFARSLVEHGSISI